MIIKLENATSSAEINTFGAELKSYVYKGKEIMWCGDPAFWGKTSPILFPAIGNVRLNKTIIGGKEYEMKKHGFARDMEFSAVKMSNDSAKFVLNANDETSKNYPFEFVFAIKYQLEEQCLRITYSVTNNSAETMPFCIGAHPALAVGNLDEYVVEFEHTETASTPVMNLDTRLFASKNRIPRLNESKTLRLNYDMFDNDVVYFDNIKSRAVSLLNKDGEGTSISFVGFNSLGLWTPAGKGAGFLCVEPWCGSDDYDSDDNIFAHKKDIQQLEQGETKMYSMTIARVE